MDCSMSCIAKFVLNIDHVNRPSFSLFFLPAMNTQFL
jgi:hypothetical protein